MPDDGLPSFSETLYAREKALREARYSAGAALSWRDWWLRLREDEAFAELITERDRIYPPDNTAHTEWLPPVSWHLETLRKAGFTIPGAPRPAAPKADA